MASPPLLAYREKQIKKALWCLYGKLGEDSELVVS